MKHAINELKTMLDTWGPHKDGEWNDHMKKAIAVLENVNRTYTGPVDLNEHRRDMAETNLEEQLAALHEDGKKAWADVPDATAWVEEQRGNVVPPDEHVEAFIQKAKDLGYYDKELLASICGDVSEHRKHIENDGFQSANEYTKRFCRVDIARITDSKSSGAMIEYIEGFAADGYKLDSVQDSDIHDDVVIALFKKVDVDADLGELDPAKACNLNDGPCDSCQ